MQDISLRIFHAGYFFKDISKRTFISIPCVCQTVKVTRLNRHLGCSNQITPVTDLNLPSELWYFVTPNNQIHTKITVLIKFESTKSF